MIGVGLVLLGVLVVLVTISCFRPRPLEPHESGLTREFAFRGGLLLGVGLVLLGVLLILPGLIQWIAGLD